MADRVGQQFGNYRLVALLGQGGYAEVYLGQHVRLNMQAAIKVLHAYVSGSEAEHFQHEAETIATLVHPAIVRVFDYDVQEGVPFLVMDHALGGPLRRRYPRGSLVPLPQLNTYVKQMGAALQYAHERKFIHRDVKPENMLVGRHEEALLSDFGLAALAHSTGSLSAQEAVGTLPYMAPEQIEGHPRAASDQYALGVVVYEWLCGARPFEGSVSEVMVQHLSLPPPPLRERVPTISPEVEQVVLRALAKEPKERFATVAAFAQALGQASQLGPSQAILQPLDQPAPGLAAAPSYATVAMPAHQITTPTEATPPAGLPVGALEPTVYPVASPPGDLTTPQSQVADETPPPRQSLEPTAAWGDRYTQRRYYWQRGARRHLD
jgi:eukaryotic-like serine/threonine-protein kinase